MPLPLASVCRIALGTMAVAAICTGQPGRAGSADPVTIATARGPATFAAAPARVVALDPAAIDTLAALGVQPAGVPQDVTLTYLDPVLKRAKPVGTTADPDAAALSALKPDAVIVGARSAPAYDRLCPLAPVIDMSIGDDVLEDARARLEAYGRLFGMQERAQRLQTALDARIAAVKRLGKDKGKALVLVTTGPKIAAFGVGSRFGWLHSVTGLPEAHPGLKNDPRGNAVSFEFIAEADPEWIFVIDRDAALGEAGDPARQTLDNPLVAATRAGQKGHIVYLDPAEAYVADGGYQSLMDTLDTLEKALSKPDAPEPLK